MCNAIVYNNPCHKANLLGDYFSTVYEAKSDTHIWSANHHPKIIVQPDVTLVFTEEIIHEVICGLRGDNCSTPDCIPSIFLKKFALFLCEPLQLIFERSYNDAVVPDLFKKGIVTTVHKEGPKTQRENYRPITQGSIICKIFEKILVRHIENHLSRNELIDDAQHGFVKHRSTCTQLTAMFQHWAGEMNEKRDIHRVYFDQKSAFDHVDHDILLHKMSVLGIHPRTIAWCSAYLSDRSFCVKMENCLGRSFSAPSGVPQGGCVSPLLYSIYEYD